LQVSEQSLAVMSIQGIKAAWTKEENSEHFPKNSAVMVLFFYLAK
jgi:hypothetical protein